MRQKHLASLCIFLCIALAFSLYKLSEAEKRADFTKVFSIKDQIPFLGDKPNLNGTWQVMNRANYNLEAHEPESAMALIEGPVKPIPDKRVVALGAVGAVPAGIGVVVEGKIPYRESALKQRKQNKKNWLERDPEIKCYLPGIPRATYMHFPFQIFQSGSSLFMTYEYAGANRTIHFKDVEEPPAKTWMGHSTGKWEGNTLVVKTNNFNGKTWLDRAGNFHSEELVVIERFTLKNEHLMTYEATLTDPKVYTKPWSIKMNLYKKQGKDARLMQFKCPEFVEELMYGHLRSKKPSYFNEK